MQTAGQYWPAVASNRAREILAAKSLYQYALQATPGILVHAGTIGPMLRHNPLNLMYSYERQLVAVQIVALFGLPSESTHEFTRGSAFTTVRKKIESSGPEIEDSVQSLQPRKTPKSIAAATPTIDSDSAAPISHLRIFFPQVSGRLVVVVPSVAR